MGMYVHNNHVIWIMQPIFRSVLLMERLFYDEVDFLNGKQGLAQHTLANILHSPTHNPATP